MRSLRYDEITSLHLKYSGNPGSVAIFVDAGGAHKWSLGALHIRPAVTQPDAVGLDIRAIHAGALDALPHEVQRVVHFGRRVARFLVVALLIVRHPGRDFRLPIGGKEIRAGQHSLRGSAANLDEARIVDADTGDRTPHIAVFANFVNRVAGFVAEPGHHLPVRLPRVSPRGFSGIIAGS